MSLNTPGPQEGSLGDSEGTEAKEGDACAGGGGAPGSRFRSAACTRASLTASCPALRAHRAPTHATLANAHTRAHTPGHTPTHRTQLQAALLARSQGTRSAGEPLPAPGARHCLGSNSAALGPDKSGDGSGTGERGGRCGGGSCAPRASFSWLSPHPLRRRPQLACGGVTRCARARRPGTAVGSSGSPRGPDTRGRRAGSSGIRLQGARRSRARGLGCRGGAERQARKGVPPRVSRRSLGTWRLVSACRTGTAFFHLSPASPLSGPAAGGGWEPAGRGHLPAGGLFLPAWSSGRGGELFFSGARPRWTSESFLPPGDGGGRSASLLPGWDEPKIQKCRWPAALRRPQQSPPSLAERPQGDLGVRPPAWWALRHHEPGQPALQLR